MKRHRRTCRYCREKYVLAEPAPDCKEHSGACEPILMGFATMSRDRAVEIASRGGTRAHELGVAHEYNEKSARAAGRKGGLASRTKRETKS